jgi:hypothetical protein
MDVALYLATLTVGIMLIGPSIDTMLDVTEVDAPAESGTRWTLVVLAAAQVAFLLAAASLGVFKPRRCAYRPLANVETRRGSRPMNQLGAHGLERSTEDLAVRLEEMDRRRRRRPSGVAECVRS